LSVTALSNDMGCPRHSSNAKTTWELRVTVVGIGSLLFAKFSISEASTASQECLESCSSKKQNCSEYCSATLALCAIECRSLAYIYS
jgi:hypothetical protein